VTNKKYLPYIISSLFLLLGCSSGGFNTLKYTFDNNTGGAKFYQSAGKPWSINHEDKITRVGEGSVRFELRPDDTWWDSFKNSHRTEMRFNETYGGWYGFSMYIPDDGSYLGSKTYMGQWHAVGKGSSQRGKPVHPAISQCFMGQFDTNMLGIKVYGDSGLQFMEVIPNFPRGEWVDFVYEIKFSSREDGILNVWMNGKQVVKYKGPNTYRGAVHMFKFGIYTLRSNEMNQPIVVYFDEYGCGAAYESVDPSKGEIPRRDM
jgi:hypothetical protein